LAHANNPNDNRATEPWRIHSTGGAQMNRLLLAYIIGLIVGAGAFYIAIELILK
jgi:hypothetical protein